jgi:hypothetical protein
MAGALRRSPADDADAEGAGAVMPIATLKSPMVFRCRICGYTVLAETVDEVSLAALVLTHHAVTNHVAPAEEAQDFRRAAWNIVGELRRN